MIGSVNGNAYNVYANPMFAARVPAKDNVMSFETVRKSAEQAKTESAEQTKNVSAPSVPMVDLSTLTGDSLAAYNVIKGLDRIFSDLNKSGLTPEQMKESASESIKKLLASEPLCRDNGSSDYNFYFYVGNVEFSITVEGGLKAGDIDEKEADAFYSRMFAELENTPGGRMSVNSQDVRDVPGRKEGMGFVIQETHYDSKVFDREFYIENDLVGLDDQGIKDFLLKKHGSPTNNMTKKEYDNFVWDVYSTSIVPKGALHLCIDMGTGELSVGSMPMPSEVSIDMANPSPMYRAMAGAPANAYFNFAMLFALEWQYMQSMAAGGLTISTDQNGYGVWADFLADFK